MMRSLNVYAHLITSVDGKYCGYKEICTCVITAHLLTCQRRALSAQRYALASPTSALSLMHNVADVLSLSSSLSSLFQTSFFPSLISLFSFLFASSNHLNQQLALTPLQL